MRKSFLVIPALAIVVSVGCASASGAQSTAPAKKSPTTTIAKKKKKATTTTTIVKGATNPTILDVLGTIQVMNEHPQGYSRSLFKHWVDADGDGCDTREEVLIAESLTKPQVDAYGCKVVEGDWFSPYEGGTYTQPGDLDIDHMVPLAEAWGSGARRWTTAVREAFANDLAYGRSLIAVTASSNRSKGEQDPAEWLPPRTDYRCRYVSSWIGVKYRWKLSVDSSEQAALRVLATNCGNPRMVVPPRAR